MTKILANKVKLKNRRKFYCKVHLTSPFIMDYPLEKNHVFYDFHKPYDI